MIYKKKELDRYYIKSCEFHIYHDKFLVQSHKLRKNFVTV